MSKCKILQVNKFYYPVVGGVERVLQQVAEGLNSETDMQVLVCQRKGRGAKEQVNGVSVTRSGSIGTFFSMPVSLSFFRNFRKMSRDRDVVQLHMPFPLGDLALFLSGYRGRVLLWWHSDIVRQQKLMWLYRPLMNWTLRRADRILVATEGHIKGSAYLKDHEEKCVIVPYGVELPPEELLQETEMKAGTAEALRQENEEARQVRVLFVGRLVPYKGVAVLLRAFAKVKGAELTVAGTGAEAESLHLLAKDLHIEEKVHFFPELSDQDVKAEMQRCDFLVLPSVERNEAFGLVQIEAMSYGRPVINTRLASGVPYVSLDGETGITVEPGDADGLAAAMQKLIDDPALRRNYGQAARKRVEEYFSVRNMLQRAADCYEHGGTEI